MRLALGRGGHTVAGRSALGLGMMKELTSGAEPLGSPGPGGRGLAKQGPPVPGLVLNLWRIKVKAIFLMVVLAAALLAGCTSGSPTDLPASGYAPSPPPVIYAPPVLPEAEDDGIVETENATAALGVA